MRSWKIFFISLLPLIVLKAYSLDYQDSIKYDNWYNLDPKLDKKMGVSVDRAYKELLVNKTPHNVVVAVIDGGVDIYHEDIKDNIWVNKDEIPDNGIDDDQNGYIDDVNGWNFLGNEDGENIDYAPLELTRLYGRYSKMFKGFDKDSLLKANNMDYDFYLDLKNKFEEDSINLRLKLRVQKKKKELYIYNDSILKSFLNTNIYNKDSLNDIKLKKNSVADSARNFLLNFYANNTSLNDVEEKITNYQNRVDYNFNPELNPRTIVGDDADSWETAIYGNNDVIGDDPSHGTMVSGVIAAIRNNNLGVKGIATNVEIMVIRAVPNGDEWDKDIASAIQYAINNGAQIINMSFGKDFSPHKQFVDSIVKGVDKSNVLLVQAAGNDGMNIDEEDNFPNKYSESGEILVNNWITVGASTITAKHKKLAASFSNYGEYSVDVFAPGRKLLLCIPNDEYKIGSGTSFASPVVSGIATLLKSYYPKLTAAEIKQIIIDSSIKKKFIITEPGTTGKNKEIKKLKEISVSGGLANAYEALLLAQKIYKEKGLIAD